MSGVLFFQNLAFLPLTSVVIIKIELPIVSHPPILLFFSNFSIILYRYIENLSLSEISPGISNPIKKDSRLLSGCLSPTVYNPGPNDVIVSR
jgi:hypothetical protein